MQTTFCADVCTAQSIRSYCDHATGLVPWPVIVHDKLGVDDPHDDATMAIDEEGHLWIFVSGRHTSRRGYIYRGKRSCSINDWDLLLEQHFAFDRHPNGDVDRRTDLYYVETADNRAFISPTSRVTGRGACLTTWPLQSARRRRSCRLERYLSDSTNGVA